MNKYLAIGLLHILWALYFKDSLFYFLGTFYCYMGVEILDSELELEDIKKERERLLEF